MQQTVGYWMSKKNSVSLRCVFGCGDLCLWGCCQWLSKDQLLCSGGFVWVGGVRVQRLWLWGPKGWISIWGPTERAGDLLRYSINHYSLSDTHTHTHTHTHYLCLFQCLLNIQGCEGRRDDPGLFWPSSAICDLYMVKTQEAQGVLPEKTIHTVYLSVI